MRSPPAAIHDALLKVNAQLHESLFDDSLSGTTACVVYVNGSELVVSNVGDSRCVLAVRNGGGVTAKELSWDQTPFVDSEVERVQQAGARVLTLAQMEGDKPLGKIWTNEMECDGDPPRRMASGNLFRARGRWKWLTSMETIWWAPQRTSAQSRTGSGSRRRSGPTISPCAS